MSSEMLHRRGSAAILLKALLTSAVLIILPALAIPVASKGNFEGHTDRPLRYHPDGTDFVIENGTEFFNRPLYGTNTAFRVDAGDKPEFSLYLPGRGGNLRLGIKTNAGQKWLFDAEHVLTRYRPGSMLYEIRDQLLGRGRLSLTVLPMGATEGLVLRVDLNGTAAPVELIWAYGGASGERGRRDGDIGTENIPISQYFQLKPEFCRGNSFTIEGNTFTLRSKPATIIGLAPRGARLAIADATRWGSLSDLIASASNSGNNPVELPVVVGRATLHPRELLHLGLQRVAQASDDRGELDTYKAVKNERLGPDGGPAVALPPAYQSQDLPRIFADAE